MPSAKIMKLQESISRILSLSTLCKAKELASVAGQLISMLLAFGNTPRSINVFPDFGASILVLPFILHDSVRAN